MKSFEEKVLAFLKLAHDGPFDLPADLDVHLRQSLVAAGFDQVSSGGSDAGASKASKPHKVSGYNLFMSDQMAQLKEQGVASNERMGQVSKRWKELDDAGKKVWNDKAVEQNASAAQAAVAPAQTSVAAASPKKPSGPKKLSGYQFYVKKNMPQLVADKTVAPKERMKQLGSQWKALSGTEQDAYKKEAEAFNESVANGTVGDATVVADAEEEAGDQ